MSTETPSLSVGMVLYPLLTQLDLAGPYEVFARMPRTDVHLIATSPEPIPSEHGLTIAPTTDFDSAPPLDVLFIPGGPGQQLVTEDERFVSFLRKHGREARYVTAVCTGSLLLGAAGLLQGYRATTYWMFLELLRPLVAEPSSERVVVDRNRITGGGVTAGIDYRVRRRCRALRGGDGQEDTAVDRVRSHTAVRRRFGQKRGSRTCEERLRAGTRALREQAEASGAGGRPPTRNFCSDRGYRIAFLG
jgi:transcriptional regulator GlxA family with amidase domain